MSTLLREMLLGPDAPDWSQAKCAGMDVRIFFPEPTQGGHNRPTLASMERAAAAICGDCPLREPCAEFATRNFEEGAWGGTAWEDRFEDRKRRGIKWSPTGAHLMGERPEAEAN